MSLSNYAENKLLIWAFTTDAAPTRPTAWYVAPHTADPTEDGSVAELVAGVDASFVRKAVTFATPTVGSAASTGAVSWTPVAGTHVVTHVSLWDALTGGNCWMIGALLLPRTVTNANPLSIAIGDLVAVLD